MINNEDLIIAISSLIKDTKLDEFEELKESIDNINSESNKILSNNNLNQNDNEL